VRIYKVDFDPFYPVGHTLIIAAKSKRTARKIAEDVVRHTGIKSITEVDISEPCVIEYLSGDY